MLIHAYRRKELTQVHTGKTNIEFKPNDAGDVVAEVADQDDADLLLAIPEGYRAYKSDKAVEKTAKTPAAKAPTAAELAAAAAATAAAAAGAKTGTDTPGAGTGNEEKPFLLKGEKPEDDIDLGAMDRDALKEFAKTNEVRIHHTWPDDKVRQTLFDAFAPE
jgi:hypothetical protein